MSRVKRAVAGRKKRQTLVERTKGYYGTSSRTFRGMKEQAQHSGGMALLDLDVPYASLLADTRTHGAHADPAQQSLDLERLIAMAQPVVDAILQPGFPFALGCSFIIPD